MRNLVGNCLALGPSISTLTVYAFSTENWGRPQDEVDALLGLIEGTLRAEADGCISAASGCNSWARSNGCRHTFAACARSSRKRCPIRWH